MVDLAALREWLGLPATVVSDEALGQVVEAESRLQATACSIPPEGVTPEQVQALYRRVGREVAAKNIPLGALGVDSEQGPSSLSRWDAEIERLEGPSRRWVFG